MVHTFTVSIPEVGVAKNRQHAYRTGGAYNLSTYLLQMAAIPFEARWSYHYVIEWSICAAMEG